MNKQEEEALLSSSKAKMSRWIGLGASPWELFEAYSKIKDLSEWLREFGDLAQRYEKAADVAEDKHAKVTSYLKAALYYHMVGLLMYEDTDEKKQVYYSVVRVYEKAAKYFRRPLERVEFPFRDVTLSAYLRKVPGIEKAPCVIVVRGADAARETQGHLVVEYFLERGLFTFQIDCPGQYEARFAGLPMTPDFEKPVSAAVDYLETRSDIDSDRIAILGVCVGGYIAPRAASLEKRLKACISVGGFYSLAEFDYPRDPVLHLQNDMKITDTEWPEKRKEYTLEGIIDKMTCPLLVVNGSEDTLMPVSQSIKIYEKANCPKDLKIYEGLGHNAFLQNQNVLFEIADWTLDKLRSKGTGN